MFASIHRDGTSRAYGICRRPSLWALLTVAAWAALPLQPLFAEDQSAPSESFRYAVARRGCTQEDAPAIEIVLSTQTYSGVGEPPAPHIRVEIASSPPEGLRDVTLNLLALRRRPGEIGRIARAELVDKGRDHFWLTGSVHIASLVPDQSVSGSYNFVWESGELKGDFQARIVKHQAVCG